MNKFTNKMTWNVYIYRHGDGIQIYNVFDHRHFVEYLNKIDFDNVMAKEKVRRELHYYFGSKAEWEVYISDIFGFMEEREFEKVSVYDQVMLNFDKFFKYLLEVKNE